MTPPFVLRAGSLPVLVSVPHVGTAVPPEIQGCLTPLASSLPDTDWHVVELYDMLDAMPVSRLHATWSRMVVDLNRPADSSPLYDTPTTGVVPELMFDGTPAYRPGAAPTATENAQRIAAFWAPYHHALAQELARLKAEHGKVLLLDLHSIRSEVPRLFEGRLPDFNLGTFDNRAAPRALTERLLATCQAFEGYTAVANGRFKGGWITRHYGQPAEGVCAVQLELSQATYMDPSHPDRVDPRRAAEVRPRLKQFIEAAAAWIDGWEAP